MGVGLFNPVIPSEGEYSRSDAVALKLILSTAKTGLMGRRWDEEGDEDED